MAEFGSEMKIVSFIIDPPIARRSSASLTAKPNPEDEPLLYEHSPEEKNLPSAHPLGSSSLAGGAEFRNSGITTYKNHEEGNGSSRRSHEA